jgi:hypothetical protein
MKRQETRSYLDIQLDRAGITDRATRKRMKDLSAAVILDALGPDGYGVNIIIDDANPANCRVEPMTKEQALGVTNRMLKAAVEKHEAREYNRTCGRMVDGFMVYDN